MAPSSSFSSRFSYSPPSFSFFILRNQLILFFTLFLLFIFLCKLLCIKNDQKKSLRYTTGNKFFFSFLLLSYNLSLSYIFFLEVQPKTLAFFLRRRNRSFTRGKFNESYKVKMAFGRFTSRRRDSFSSSAEDKKPAARLAPIVCNRHIYDVLARRKVVARTAFKRMALIDEPGSSNFAYTQLTFALRDEG